MYDQWLYNVSGIQCLVRFLRRNYVLDTEWDGTLQVTYPGRSLFHGPVEELCEERLPKTESNVYHHFVEQAKPSGWKGDGSKKDFGSRKTSWTRWESSRTTE